MLLDLKLKDTRQQPSCQCRRETHGRDRRSRTNVHPFPVKDSHPQEIIENWIIEVALPLHPEFFGSTTHVTPEGILEVTLRKVVILPTLKTLKRIMVLFPWQDRSMPTSLRKLKEVVVSKQHITSISTAPTKYAVGYGSAELVADPIWTRLLVQVTC